MFEGRSSKGWGVTLCNFDKNKNKVKFSWESVFLVILYKDREVRIDLISLIKSSFGGLKSENGGGGGGRKELPPQAKGRYGSEERR